MAAEAEHKKGAEKRKERVELAAGEPFDSPDSLHVTRRDTRLHERKSGIRERDRKQYLRPKQDTG